MGCCLSRRRRLRLEQLERRYLLAKFADVTAAVGLDQYLASTGDAHGPGAVFADLDNDGWPDLYLVRAGEPNELHLNRDNAGRRVFQRAAEDAGAGHAGPATGAVAGDYDNDGDLDLFVLNFDDDNVLLRNQLVETGSLQFVDVTGQTDPTPGVEDGQFGLRTATWDGITLEKSLTAAWGDPDRDGDLDLYVGNHHEWLNSTALQVGERAGQRDIFYMNNGDGTFTDVTMEFDVPGFVTASGMYESANQYFSSSNAVIFADFDNDRWPDLLVTNKVGGADDREMLYINQGADEQGVWQGFSTETYELPNTFGHRSGGAMGVAVADLEHDGDLDIYITDWSSAGSFDDRSSGRNDIWINQLSETGRLDFVHSSAAGGLFSWGVQWEDFDNDGFQDLHVATHRGAFDFYYANTLGALTDDSVDAGFVSVSNARGDVAADYNRDGWLDLFVVNIDDNVSAFYENRSAADYADRHFLSLKLVGNPELPGPLRSTRDALGARVVIRADLDGSQSLEPHETLIREVQSGSSNAASTSSLEVEVGLGKALQADVTVYWPSGRVTDMGTIAADEFVVVHERRTTVGTAAAGAQNLVPNPGFEAGIAPWLPLGDASVTVTSAQSHQGLAAAHVTNRTAAWNGVGQSMIGIMQPGATYQISVWVKLDGVDQENIGLTLQQTDGSGTKWTPLDWSVGSQSEWIRLSGSYTLDVVGSLTRLFLYVEGPNPGVNFFVDDLSVAPFDPVAWKAEADARIEQLRKRDAQVIVLNAAGNPVPGAVIDISQSRHAFGLGTTINSGALPHPEYAQFLRDNFEWGVMEFEAKWHQTEQSQGNVDYALADRIVEFARANDIALRGHTIFRGVEQFVPAWIRQLTPSQLRSAVNSRLASVVDHFRGDFRHWDVNNEMLHGSFYEDRLPGIRTSMFQQARAADPDTRLFVNDYGVITGGLAATYRAFIEELIAGGAPIDGIGVQGHFPAAPAIVSPLDVLQRLDVLGPLGLPVWITEFDVQDPDVESRADQLEALYRTAFSHPAVDGILMWGFWAGAHWRGADAALVDQDWTVNAAGRRYQELVAEWTTHTAGSTGGDGRFDLRGFHGTYDVTVTVPGQAPLVEQFVLQPGAGTQVITLNLDIQPASFVVESLVPTSSGFEAHFSADLDTSQLNLYDTRAGASGPADVVLQGVASGPVEGSLVVDPASRKVTFVKTGQRLQPDVYSVRLRSGTAGFRTASGEPLDGDGDGTGGDDLISSFSVAATAENAVIIGIPDIVRGPGQPINLPANTTQGIPLTINAGTNVRSIEFQIRHDPTTLTITAATLGDDAPIDATVVLENGTPGVATVSFASSTSLAAGTSTVIYLVAAVPTLNASGIYGSQAVLDIQNVTVRDAANRELPVIADDAYQLVTYLGDVSGNGRINAADAARVAGVAALIGTGFAGSGNTDPNLIGDISGNGRINAADASRLARFAALLPVPEIPPLPSGVLVTGLGMPVGRLAGRRAERQTAEAIDRIMAEPNAVAHDDNAATGRSSPSNVFETTRFFCPNVSVLQSLFADLDWDSKIDWPLTSSPSPWGNSLSFVSAKR